MHFPRTIYYYYYVLLRHNGSKTYSSVHTHTVIHANTSTKNAKRFLKTVKNGIDAGRMVCGKQLSDGCVSARPYPLYLPSQRCGLCQNFKQTTLTTRSCKVRTNFYPPLMKTFQRAYACHQLTWYSRQYPGSMAWLIHFTSPAGWLPVHRDQLRAQRPVTNMGKLYLLPQHNWYLI